MGIYLAGVEYSAVNIAGQTFDALQFAGADYLASDTPGTLSITATPATRGFTFVWSITDPNGIRSITTATLTARDGTNANVLSDFIRSDANTFAGTDARRNARWSSGTLSVTYVDAASGESRTLTETWST